MEIVETYRQIPNFSDNPLQCILEWTNLLGRFSPFLSNIVEELRLTIDQLKELRIANITFIYKEDILLVELNGIATQVLAFIKIVEQLHKMAGDKERLQRIFAEVDTEKNRGVKVYRQGNADFRELNGFISELRTRMRGVDELFEQIDGHCGTFCNESEKASKKAESLGNKAWQKKNGSRAVALVCFGLAAASPFSFTLMGVGAGICAAGVGGYFYQLNKAFSCKERECFSAKKKFEQLNEAKKGLQKITGEIQRGRGGGVPIHEDLNASIIGEDRLLTQLPTSLKNLITTLEFKEMDFREMRKKVESIIKDIDK